MTAAFSLGVAIGALAAYASVAYLFGRALASILREAALAQAMKPGASPLPADQRERLAFYRAFGRAMREAQAEPERRH